MYCKYKRGVNGLFGVLARCGGAPSFDIHFASFFFETTELGNGEGLAARLVIGGKFGDDRILTIFVGFIDPRTIDKEFGCSIMHNGSGSSVTGTATNPDVVSGVGVDTPTGRFIEEIIYTRGSDDTCSIGGGGGRFVLKEIF